MAIPVDQLRPGAVFQFKNGLRRVTALRKEGALGFMVDWEYVDGSPRRRQSGSLWFESFRVQALALVPDPSLIGEKRTLLPSGRTVACLEQPVAVTLHTRCPLKWVMVDMESGELWRHDGQRFERLSPNEALEVQAVARTAAENAS